jgi:Uma2 family endonuclease
MGQYESELSSILIRLLGNYVDEHDLGKVFAPDCMTRIEPGRIREPDVSFVSWERMPPGPRTRDPVLSAVPNLAIEVLSESNTPQEMEAKRIDYFSIGVEEVWEIDPGTRTARVYTSPDAFLPLDPSGVLDGGKIVPGWQLSLEELFARADRMGPRS